MGPKHVFPYSRHYKCKATVAQFYNRLPTVHATLGTGGEGTANGTNTSTPGIVADAGRNAVCSLCELVVPGYAHPNLHKGILNVSTTHDPGTSLRTKGVAADRCTTYLSIYLNAILPLKSMSCISHWCQPHVTPSPSMYTEPTPILTPKISHP
jgi:hypothetical protein